MSSLYVTRSYESLEDKPNPEKAYKLVYRERVDMHQQDGAALLLTRMSILHQCWAKLIVQKALSARSRVHSKLSNS